MQGVNTFLLFGKTSNTGSFEGESKLSQKFPEPTVGGLILDDKGRLLLVKSPKWKHDKWTVPGGHIEVGESARQAIVREVREETGLNVEPIALLLVQEAIFSDEYYKPMHYLFMDFLCETKNPSVKLDKRELSEYRWFKVEESYDADVESYTRNLLNMYQKFEPGESKAPSYLPASANKKSK